MTPEQYASMQEKDFSRPRARVHNLPKPKNKKSRREANILNMRAAGLPKREIAMTACLSRSKLAWEWKLEPEQHECVIFSDRMREHSIKQRYTGIWGHLANEGKRHKIVAAILNAMGMHPGGTDYFFMGPWGHGVIEFKVGDNKLSLTQQCYRDWCDADGVKHAVAYSADEAESTLKQWGALI